jgi:hypothetical protein
MAGRGVLAMAGRGVLAMAGRGVLAMAGRGVLAMALLAGRAGQDRLHIEEVLPDPCAPLCRERLCLHFPPFPPCLSPRLPPACSAGR